MTRRKDGLWQETLTINGKRKYFYGNTKGEVLQKIRAYQNKQSSGMMFETVAYDWRDEHYTRIEAATAHGYEASFKRAVKEFGDLTVESITPEMISNAVKDLTSKRYSRKVVATFLGVLRMIFDRAVISGMIFANPCTSVKIPGGLPRKKRELPSDEDIKKVSSSEWLLPFFLLYTGCRRGEALAIEGKDIDRENKLIHITKSVGYNGNRPYIKPPKTEAGKRDIVLLDILAERLPEKDGLLFTNKDGNIYSQSCFERAWKKWQKENDTTVTAHQLRHGFATILFDAGLDPKDAQDLLGHSTIAVTQDIYTHIRRQRRESSAEKINRFLQSN